MKQKNKRWLGRVKHILICAGLALFIAGVGIPSGLTYILTFLDILVTASIRTLFPTFMTDAPSLSIF